MQVPLIAGNSQTQQGSALVGVILLMLILAVLSASMSSMMGTTSQGYTLQMQSAQALFAAEAGLELSLLELVNDTDTDSSGTKGAISSVTVGSGAVYTTYSGGVVTAYGTSGEASRVVSATVTVTSGSSTGGTYDLSTRTPGVDVFGYSGGSTTQVPTVETTPSTQFLTAEYEDMESDNATFHADAVASNNEYAQMRFVITLDEDESDVTRVSVTWNGYGVNQNSGKTDGASLYIWNYSTSAYDLLSSSADTESEVTIGTNITTNITDYIGGGSQDTITLFVVSADKKDGVGFDNTLYTDYLAIAIATSSSVTATSTYDYSNRTPGTNIFGYGGESSTQLPTDASTPSTEFLTAEYTDMNTDDGTEHSQDTSSNGQYAQKRFAVEIDESVSDIVQITITWTGHAENDNSSSTDGAVLYVWNYSTTAYELLETSADTESDVTLSGVVTLSIANYLGGAGSDTVTFYVVTADSKNGGPKDNILFTDYISVAVGTGSGGGGGSGTTSVTLTNWSEVAN